ncbi:polysaccharide biosynthesis protein [Horticoccus luteus]|uniref:Polysaccharide biosynthesis protein n=1 Tax=Horticoccus luteus TaxID=2862869 RepID=A0A8F9TSX4_9BACT|nr:nucleoside-diphosphate sugar epimerase/dehydratase [Horticoccus luteus]QYM77502.1 polysaccharide biosynthesis protein [Horticoccus luteus]
MAHLDLNFSRNQRVLMLAVAYLATLTAAFYLAFELRFDFAVPLLHQEIRTEWIAIVVGLQMVGLIGARQLGSVLTYFSIPDLTRVVLALTVVSVLLLIPHVLQLNGFTIPRGVLLADYMLAIAGVCGLRLSARITRERFASTRTTGAVKERIAIIGAGDAGAALANEFISHPSRGFRPVVFFDDDRTKHGKTLHGVRVVGVPETVERYLQQHEITKAVIAMPTATAKRVREVVLAMTAAGLKVETMPSMAELASGRVRASRIRPVQVEDLLGRDPVALDAEAIRHLVQGEVVMVTGSGGSIGSEICRQIAALAPRQLLMVEQSEGSLFLIEQELNELGHATVAVPLVADILDRARMDYIFTRYRPAVVFHAAAHKHVFLMERQPAEAMRNNAVGTRELASLAGAHETRSFVLISTDKAINPTSVMGATKRLAELQLLAVQRRYPATKFLAVRFGNVLGSSGSVIPIFRRQIDKGGPITVTHPDVTRYFMTIPEAVGLVLQATVQGKGGDICVLDMGQPVKIIDLARQMIELSGLKVGDDIEIQITGLKPGEKLFEELRHHDESHQPTQHTRIMRFVGNGGDFSVAEARFLEVSTTLHQLEPAQVKQLLREFVPEYTPYLE